MAKFHLTAEEVQKTKWYPKYHVAPPIGWLNDPNGFCFYKGEYHIFYQYHPYSAKWGPMHWGHSTSKNLFDWKHQPIAIAPGEKTEGKEKYDWDGCFSGCGFEYDGKLWLMYTGQNTQRPLYGKSKVTERQCMAYSEDGINFTKFEKNPVIDIPDDDPVIGNVDFRDPKIWKHGDKFYCVMGDKTPDKTNTQIVLFESENFFDWKFKSVVASAKGNEGTMWECPCFAHFDGADVMLISPQHIEPEGRLFQNLHQTGYMIGNLNYETGVFEHGKFFMFDYGFDFYATTLMQDPNGRYLIITWLAMWENIYPEQKDDWACMLTIPRELQFKNGKIYTVPPKELEEMRGEGVHYKNLSIDKATELDGVKGAVGELLVEIDTKKSKAFKIELRSNGNEVEDEDKEKTILLYDEATKVLTLNRNMSGVGPKGTREVELTPFETLKLRIYLDKSSVEIFINDGEFAMTTRVYPKDESDKIIFTPKAETLELISVDYYNFDR